MEDEILKKLDEMTIKEQGEMIEDIMMKLADEHKREKELLCKRVIELEAKLDKQQALELEIIRTRGAIEVMKLMTDEGDTEEAKMKLESLQQQLEGLNQNEREKELVLKKIAQVEAKLEKKRALELQIVIIKRVVEVMKHVIGEGGDGEANKRLESMEQLLKDKEEQLEEIQ